MTKRIAEKIAKSDRCTVYTARQWKKADRYLNKKLRKVNFAYARKEALNGDDTFLKILSE